MRARRTIWLLVNVDALFISGDVYDRGIPPVTMVDLLLGDSHAVARTHARHYDQR